MLTEIKNVKKEIKTVVSEYGYNLIDEYYVDKTHKKVIIQDSNGYKYDVFLYSIKRGSPLDFVGVHNPFTIYNISRWLEIEGKPFRLFGYNDYNGCNEKLSFQCIKESCREVFKISWVDIYSKGCGCPFCSGNKVGERNNFEYLYPNLSLEWDYDKNKNSPNQYTGKSGENAWWICKSCGNGWRAKICNRAYGGGCPACSSAPKVVSDKNRLSIRFPDISTEWHPTKNGDLTPNEVSYGSNKEIWWTCSKCNHEWNAPVNNRTKGSNCPKCSVSRKESKIANDLKDYFKEIYNMESEYRIFKNPETGYWLPYDIYIPYGENPELNGFYIEIHWEQHYRLSYFHNLLSKVNETTPEEEFEYQKHKDRIKRRFARKNGTYIEIDLRKIKTTEEAIKHIENILESSLL